MTEPFLRVPPFPGHRGLPLTRPGASAIDPDELRSALVAGRVGGTFWAAQPDLPSDTAVLLAPQSALDMAAMLAEAPAFAALLLPPGLPAPREISRQVEVIRTPCDPWHLARRAREIWAGPDSELGQVARLLGQPVRWFGTEPADPAVELGQYQFASPFTGEIWTARQAVEQLGEWRRLIDANRVYAAIYGVALWKRVTVDALLWDGTGPVRHRRTVPTEFSPGTPVLAWKSRTSAATLAGLEAAGARIAELEDGMIRSVGLGANCVPPLSIIVDRVGIYFDPNQPSELERMLEHDELPQTWVARAVGLRKRLIEAGITKYGQGATGIIGTATDEMDVLVTGQVEDDRSVLSGGGNCSNHELLVRARTIEGNARIVYKPHPDVEAGHRKGHIPNAVVLQHADAIVRSTPITTLIDAVRSVHVITSLAGFEALLRGKPVTTHGQPFYAGWGLTNDRAPRNPRRSRRRSLDELVAATLIGYPRYVDPVTRLPCPPEILIERMARGEASVASPLIALREWQGRLRLVWQRLIGARR